ncbi:hypothetical protein EDD70_0477 [Hydrogenoanaerobacterium saccharovorans]|uniref:Uncharacterized protein n=1 Tax=Hydrogenoanaerobacterium saccharovorans TaxID=474960 RepID=A0A1H8B0Y1_9FIRM|nr:DUF960 domain-containing protein [Hydrogenoanaerobacterium saccharovorans]RPF47679.1 hypothetical protein EDD70_0477 [Hydrogenoanaerobacterium saccharovorans]SEM75768.1 hypothetical protein SAMN05216180_1616 [Hydrogenoanaerobacterium saccharovorans]
MSNNPKYITNDIANTVTVKVSNPISNRKIFCIDHDTHATMLFAEEY